MGFYIRSYDVPQGSFYRPLLYGLFMSLVIFQKFFFEELGMDADDTEIYLYHFQPEWPS